MLWVDGFMGGIWWHERKSSRVIIDVQPFNKLDAGQKRAAVEEAERVAAFLGGPLELRFGPPKLRNTKRVPEAEA